MPPRAFLIPALLVTSLWAAALSVADPSQSYTEEIEGSLATFDMVAISPGTLEFAIGDESPRRVRVKRFWMGKTEVTWDEFDVFLYGLDIPQRLRSAVLDRRFHVGTGPSRPYTDVTWEFGRCGYPAIGITHHHAVQYCEWLSQKTGRKYRLPTEMEWEYAGRAGRTVGHHQIDRIAWHRQNSVTAEFDEGKTHPVATKRANHLGVHDMLGNVWEWCTSAEGTPVARGGSWQQPPQQLHPRVRLTDFGRWSVSDPDDPKSRWWLSEGNCVGFRVVRAE